MWSVTSCGQVSTAGLSIGTELRLTVMVLWKIEVSHPLNHIFTWTQKNDRVIRRKKRVGWCYMTIESGGAEPGHTPPSCPWDSATYDHFQSGKPPGRGMLEAETSLIHTHTHWT
ncbi:hypothetical protein RRG08_035889 [Elysia crispata]|uniref:Uncharacterized protein n=1 Tax=Elysia crispata TaxID=231223 RepID=A0AAE1A336_9GAST|nr:hypothetical protein RRG08_035889 [Elysia crispata]